MYPSSMNWEQYDSKSWWGGAVVDSINNVTYGSGGFLGVRMFNPTPSLFLLVSLKIPTALPFFLGGGGGRGP